MKNEDSMEKQRGNKSTHYGNKALVQARDKFKAKSSILLGKVGGGRFVYNNHNIYIRY